MCLPRSVVLVGGALAVLGLVAIGAWGWRNPAAAAAIAIPVAIVLWVIAEVER